VKREEDVWVGIVRWIDYDMNNRKGHIAELMKNVRMGLIDAQFFDDKIKDHPYVTANQACWRVILETLTLRFNLQTNMNVDTQIQTHEIARPRIPHEILFAIGGWSVGNPTNCIETYDTRADRWMNLEEVDPTGPRAYHGSAAIGFDIFVIGGCDGTDFFSSCRCFNAVTKTWRDIAPMHARRCYVSVAVLGDTVYAIGGHDGYTRQKTAEHYNYRTNQWTLIAPMSIERSDASAAAVDGKMNPVKQ
jgi:kelch-like protein 10